MWIAVILLLLLLLLFKPGPEISVRLVLLDVLIYVYSARSGAPIIAVVVLG